MNYQDNSHLDSHGFAPFAEVGHLPTALVFLCPKRKNRLAVYTVFGKILAKLTFRITVQSWRKSKPRTWCLAFGLALSFFLSHRQVGFSSPALG